ALEISRAIARYLDHEWDEELLGDDADEALGRHPWDATYPIVLDMAAAGALGYTPVGDYAATVVAELDWLVAAARKGDPDGGRARPGRPVLHAATRLCPRRRLPHARSSRSLIVCITSRCGVAGLPAATIEEIDTRGGRHASRRRLRPLPSAPRLVDTR